jgi:hypothetical protein
MFRKLRQLAHDRSLSAEGRAALEEAYQAVIQMTLR